jgi:hypothetical protein
MEKTAYFKKMHHIGKIAGSISIAIMFGIPVIACLVFNIMPTFKEYIAVAGTLLAIYVPTALSEVLSYTPMLGSSAYLTFLTGNVGNIKIPVTLNAFEITESDLGTERGDAVAAVAVGTASLVTMICLIVGVVLLVPLEPVLKNPTVLTCTAQMLPALFGCQLVQQLTSKKSGDYIINGKWKVFLAAFAIICLIHFFIVPINGKEGYLMIIMLVGVSAIAVLMNKLGIIKVVPAANPKSAEENPVESKEAK